MIEHISNCNPFINHLHILLYLVCSFYQHWLRIIWFWTVHWWKFNNVNRRWCLHSEWRISVFEVQYNALCTWWAISGCSHRGEKKNCYKINVNERERVLVRASFYYGDYDLKFSLQFLTFSLMAIIGPLSTLRTCMILFLMGQYILWKQTIIAFV